MRRKPARIISQLLCLLILLSSPLITAMELPELEQNDEWVIDIPSKDLSPLISNPKFRDISQEIASYFMQDLADSLYIKPIGGIKRSTRGVPPHLGIFTADSLFYITPCHIPPPRLKKYFSEFPFHLVKLSLPSCSISKENALGTIKESFSEEELKSLNMHLTPKGNLCADLNDMVFKYIEHSESDTSNSKEEEEKEEEKFLPSQYNAKLDAIISPDGTYAAVESKYALSLYYSIDWRLKKWLEQHAKLTLIDYIRLKELISLKQRGKSNSVAAAKLWALLNNSFSDTPEEITSAFKKNTLQLIPAPSLKDRVLVHYNPYTPDHYRNLARCEALGKSTLFALWILSGVNAGVSLLVGIFTDVEYYWPSFAVFGFITISYTLTKRKSCRRT